ncbi:MAG: rhodanese-like domain-containing protein [Caldilineaceae bacterium]
MDQHRNDPNIRILESNEDPLLYATGHIPGAKVEEIDWYDDLNDPCVRLHRTKAQFEALLSRLGVSNDTTVILYGDKSNWWATLRLLGLPTLRYTNAKDHGRWPPGGTTKAAN